jgi:hypothetical protein
VSPFTDRAKLMRLRVKLSSFMLVLVCTQHTRQAYMVGVNVGLSALTRLCSLGDLQHQMMTSKGRLAAAYS